MYNLEAEKALIGCMILDTDKALDILDIVDESDFHDIHSPIVAKIRQLSEKGKVIDIITVSEGTKLDYLVECTNLVTTTATANKYTEMIKDLSNRRKLIVESTRLSQMARDTTKDIQEIISSLEQSITTLQNKKEKLEDTADVVTRTIEILEKRCMDKDKKKYSGIETGFFDLDYKLGGMSRGDLIIIAARPSMGKTSLAENIATYVSCKLLNSVAFFSLEMKKEKIINRMISSLASIDNEKMKLGRIDDNEWQKIANTSNIIATGKIVIDDTSNIKATEIRSKCRQIKRNNGLDLVVVDHLTEMWRPHTGRDAAEHEENVRSLKRLAKEMDCTVILLQQLNRGVEQRTDKRPMLSDLRETGVAEEVADVVIFIYRDDYYNPNTDRKNIAEINIAKGRDVGIGTIELAWAPMYTKFLNLVKR